LEDELPKGVKGADFRTLQQMIAQGIVEAETGASNMEATLKAVDNDDEGLQRHRDALVRHKEQVLEAKQKEREQAKRRREQEWKERQLRCEAELEQQEQEERHFKEQSKAAETQCKLELAAAAKIQAGFRGWRSRAGRQVLKSPIAVLHAQPWRCVPTS